jgi:hypothetical protein
MKSMTFMTDYARFDRVAQHEPDDGRMDPTRRFTKPSLGRVPDRYLSDCGCAAEKSRRIPVIR